MLNELSPRAQLCSGWKKNEDETKMMPSPPPCAPPRVLHRHATNPSQNSQKVPELVVREIVRLGLRADRERGDPSLGMGFTLEDAKALRQAASRRVNLSASASAGTGGGGVSAEEALYARVQAEVVKEDKVGVLLHVGACFRTWVLSKLGDVDPLQVVK